MDRLQKLVSESKQDINYLNSKATPPTRLGIHCLFYFLFAQLSSLELSGDPGPLSQMMQRQQYEMLEMWWNFFTFTGKSLPPTERNCPLSLPQKIPTSLPTPPNIFFILLSARQPGLTSAVFHSSPERDQNHSVFLQIQYFMNICPITSIKWWVLLRLLSFPSLFCHVSRRAWRSGVL